MDNDYNGYSPENGAPLRDDETMLADDFNDGEDQFYAKNENIGQNDYVQNPAANPYNNGYDQSANYNQNANYGQNNGYGSNNNNYPVTPVTPVNPPPQDFSAMYDKMFNQNQGASGIAITALIMSIAGLALTLVGTIACCCGGHLIIILGMLASVAGTVLGVLNRVWNKPGAGLANAGIIVGVIGIIWGIIMFAMLIIPFIAEA